MTQAGFGLLVLSHDARTEESRRLFAHLKRILQLDRLWLRGVNGARDEFLLAATARNLGKLAKGRGQLPDRCAKPA